jgi:hypothetical protein
MTIESAITTGLTAAFIADGTFSGFTVPVYAHIAPQTAAYPFVIYSILSSETENHLNPVGANLTLTSVDIDLSVYSSSVSQRALIMTSIKNKLHGFRGALGTENLDIRSSTMSTVSTFTESDLTGSDAQIYRSSFTFNLFYNWS